MNQLLSKYLFIYPVRYLRGEHICKYLKEVQNVEKFNEDQLKKYQWSKLNTLISESYNGVPYYHEVFSHLQKNKYNLKEIDDLLPFPTLTKNIIKNNFDNLKNRSVKKSDERTTSGSSGDPLIFHKDRLATAYMDAVMYNSYAWHGINIGDKQARFWGMPFDKKERVKAKLKDFLMNRIRLSAFDLDTDSMMQFFEKLLSFNVDYFYGYPSLIYQFARFCRTHKLNTEKLGLKAIIVTGEMILNGQKKVIEDVFNSRVVSEYGCSEVGVVGFECGKGNMHLMADNIFIEIIREGKHVLDQEGEIYVTELNSKFFPFIRYKLGDRGKLLSKVCSCGIKFPLIEVKSGRIDDYIITPDGKMVYDALLAYTFKEGIHSFKAVQSTVDSLDIYIKKNSDYDDDLERTYIKQLRNKLGNIIDIRIKYVSQIRREKSGKLRYFESKIE